jgi:twitching motility two-component system response regulator PilG
MELSMQKTKRMQQGSPDLPTSVPEVWIIDPSLTTRKILQISLRRHGIESLAFVDGVEAMQALQDPDATLPMLIIMEVLLPHLDGYSIALTMRKRLLLKTPILFLSSCDGVVHRLKGLLAGANAYLTKPFLVEEVLQVVKTLADVPSAHCEAIVRVEGRRHRSPIV